MKKIILTAVLGSAALGLAACDNAADEGDTTVITEDPSPMPTATETTVLDPAAPTGGSTVSVGPDGVQADVDTGTARVRTDGDGTTTVTTD